MENLEKALSFANYQFTLTKQRKLLAEKFKENTVLAYNGGLFQITPEFIAGVKTTRTPYVIDMNGNPIKIEDLDELILRSQEIYEKAITVYGDEFSALRTKRNVKAIVDL
jgi:hypothetical protein